METIVFKYGKETELPLCVVDDAPTQGAFDDYAEYLLSKYDVQVSLEDSIRYLKLTGAWELSEMQDLELNKGRLLWMACLDCKERGPDEQEAREKTYYWYMGE